MHELSLALSILDLAAEEAEWRGGARVAAVHLKLGPLAGVVPEALRSACELAREGLPFGGAELVIEEVPLAVYCPRCASERAPPSVWELTWRPGIPIFEVSAKTGAGMERWLQFLESRRAEAARR